MDSNSGILLHGIKINEEKPSNKSSVDEEAALSLENTKVSSRTTSIEKSSVKTGPRISSRSSSPMNQDGQLKSTKAEMSAVREENEKLKLVLSKITKDYQLLQMHLEESVQQELPEKSARHEEEEEPEFVFLSLGRCGSSELKKVDRNSKVRQEDGKVGQGLALGLDCRFDPSPSSSPRNSFNESKDKEPTETWPHKKSLMCARSEDDDVSQQNPMKKARVSVRAICNAPTMNDGCQWRKYGQKIAKGNPCPRAYYRCTVSPSCPVRKHVQRCAEDMAVLVTTYEGTHNHPLPVSATAMASTTSAAASMLKSASSTSNGTTASTAASLHGLTNAGVPTRQQFYFPNSTISTSQSHPTITLDLTSPATTTSHLQARSYPPTCLDFSASSSPFSSFKSNTLQTPWGGNYGTLLSNNTKHIIGSTYPGIGQVPHHQEPAYHQPSKETIAAATKAIAANPTFRSALAAAITSFVGNVGGNRNSV
ncbi:hypothetical protein RJ639_046445 [Escallonia herrerae]|uniref:WRKY domain-containing protein n=1 Tax=Escallonia herrerae TaxID=1293975 RepID=A0AA88W890_9ASTE|nr:hypothetical protein RJ639_046445 [Escallonia herrerae]